MGLADGSVVAKGGEGGQPFGFDTRVLAELLPQPESEEAVPWARLLPGALVCASLLIALLGAAIDESRRDIHEDIDAAGIDQAERRLEALHLVHYKLHQLQNHVNASGRLLNDLRTLRRLLLAERRGAALEEKQVALPIRRK